MADGYFPTLISKDKDPNIVSNPVWVELTDGTNAVGVTSGSLDVNVTNTSIAVSASDLDIRDLVAGVGTGEDNVLIFANTVKDGSGTDYVPLVDADGQLQVDVLTMPAITFNAEYQVDDSAGATDYGIPPLVVRDDALTTLTPVDGDYVNMRVDSTGRLWVIQRALNLTDDAVKVSANTTANSMLNPIYVQTVKGGTSATEIHDYAVTTGTGNNDYTVTGTTFLLTSVIFSASGGMKVEIQTGPLATLVTKAVGFIPKAGGTSQVFFDPPIEVPVTSTGTVRVVMTNRESSSMDCYSTIIGNDIP